MIEIVVGLIVLCILLFLGILAFIGVYNSFITLKNRIENAWAQIDVQMKKRYDLVPNLVETVKGYAKHEKETLTEITKARAATANAKTVGEKAQASNMLTGALKTLFAVSESYPELKANKNFLMLQEELSVIENTIAYSRQFYNDTVMEYNMKRQKIPYNIVASIFGFKEKEYFEPPEEEKEAIKKAPKVKFQ